MSTLNIPILVGTTRPKRMTIHAARLVHKVAQTKEGIDTQLVDPQDFSFPYDGNDPENKDPRYTDLTHKADAFVIVAPEYNHAIPGSLKRMLDSELENYHHKPIALAGVSAGPWGGLRVIEHMVLIVRELGMVVTSVDMQFPSIYDLFDDKGNLTDEAYTRRVEKALDELIWMAKALKQARDTQ